MKCSICGNKAQIRLSYTHLVYCNKCFKEMIEKRVRKNIRRNKLIKLKNTYFILDNNSIESFCTIILINRLYKKTPLQYFIISSIKEATNKENLIISETMDKINAAFIESLFSEKRLKFSGASEEAINIISVLTSEDCEYYAKINGYKGTPKLKKPENKFLNSLKKNYPAIDFSLNRSISELKKVLSVVAAEKNRVKD